jgi:co-chaperonin GroES (HSP10)
MRDKNKLYETVDASHVTLDPAHWAIIKETEALRAIGHRILVLEDEFKSGYECKDCNGSGHTEEKCPHCFGTGMWKAKPDNGSCPDCEVGTSDGRKSLGFKICPTCKGRSGMIIIPDDAKRRPCTGVILSKGSEVTEFTVGSRVLYTNYTGTDFELLGGVKLRIMLDHDVMAEYKKLKKVSPSIGTGAITKDLQEHGIAT